MLERILKFSIDQRWLVVILTAAAALLGVYSLTQLPIDAVPDITNNQVQINTELPVTGARADGEADHLSRWRPRWPGIAGSGLHPLAQSRNGFSQITAVFTDATYVYFARSQVLERLVTAVADDPAAGGGSGRWGRSAPGWARCSCTAVEYTHVPTSGQRLRRSAGRARPGSPTAAT